MKDILTKGSPQGGPEHLHGVHAAGASHAHPGPCHPERHPAEDHHRCQERPHLRGAERPRQHRHGQACQGPSGGALRGSAHDDD